MNIKPRLDKSIPKGYMYIQIMIPEYWQELIDKYSLDLKTKKLSKQEKSELKANIEKYTEHVNNSKEKISLFDSNCIANLYFDSETIYDISKHDTYSFDFSERVFYKINPIAMKKTWQTYGNNETYDLNSFIPVEKINSIEELTKSLYKDNLLKDFVLTYFLKYSYSNDGYEKIRHDYLKYIKENYSDCVFSLHDVYDRFSNYNGEYKNNTHRTKLIKEAYGLGLVNLYNESRYTDSVIRMLLIEREFDLLSDFLNGLEDSELEFIGRIVEKYSTYETIKLTVKLALENSDNEVVSRLIKIMNIKSSGVTLRVMSYDEWEREYFECVEERKTFENIDELKRYIISEYREISLDKVMGNKFNELYFDENNRQLIVEIVE